MWIISRGTISGDKNVGFICSGMIFRSDRHLYGRIALFKYEKSTTREKLFHSYCRNIQESHGWLAQIPRLVFKRRIPIHPCIREMLINLPRGLHTNWVFLSKVKPVNNFAGNYKLQWSRTVQEAELGDFTFHNLRHCAINNLRLPGNDHFTIMAISGHRTTSVFRRYNVVTEEELQKVKWKPDESRGVHQPRKTGEFGWNSMRSTKAKLLDFII